MSQRLTIDGAVLDRINRALAEIRAGRMVILVDDEDRENEGDLCLAGELVTPEAINFMATHGRGLICLALDEEQVARLELPMMAAPGRGGPPLGTAFTVSIEARTGVTTGISAADRAHTIRVASRPDSRPEDLVTPGHVFPLRARRGGVLVRAGQTEGSVDLARLAGLRTAGVICEIMNDDGTMARMPDLEVFAAKHGLLIVTIADLIQYRLQTERFVRRISEGPIRLDMTGTEWTGIVYEILGESREFLALVKGSVATPDPILCRVHSGSLIGDLFSSTPADGGSNLREAVTAIEKAGAGVVVYIPPRGELRREFDHLRSIVSGDAPLLPEQAPWTLREFGLGAQVLADLGVRQIRLLTNSQRKIAGLTGFGLEVVERVPLFSVQGHA
ncbi:3,4-dihydroxy-2-butanone-4-phosphate synthase [Chondromyces apiculatus]|uniref:3,4-dihydroxy-2-butanone 4-phosphate synthase n=1 Tax=Chondromyces apiculatus DSM 436 TaxID=1192034 RepID=A0A017TB76_9BACT|nr:3,4-dihydroxy-2-butanone-4-phosphate synthase [Chondromyces apiculatus]EYF05886.1 3,4-dihydroxy-2-butanone 4-phosphate synthase [Chondromyces apiculatus DSM 436]